MAIIKLEEWRNILIQLEGPDYISEAVSRMREDPGPSLTFPSHVPGRLPAASVPPIPALPYFFAVLFSSVELTSKADCINCLIHWLVWFTCPWDLGLPAEPPSTLLFS